MFRKIGDALRRFMYGRYGTDQLGMALLVLTIVLMLLGTFWLNIFTLLSYVALFCYCFRCYSRNIAKRRQENARFLRLISPLQDRNHRYFRCPNCRQSVRVPRGKGRIAITCPKCRNRFEKKT